LKAYRYYFLFIFIVITTFFALNYSVYSLPKYSEIVVWFNDSRVYCILLNIR